MRYFTLSISARISRYIFQGYFSSLRAELFDKGITVTAVCPGPIRTASVQNAVTEVSGKVSGMAINLTGQIYTSYADNLSRRIIRQIGHTS